jgi:predicted ferric reductase
MNNKSKKFLGWAVLLIISLIPVFLLFFFGPEANEFNNYSNITQAFGEIFGLVGMTMFALTFILSTRIKFIENVFGGLDKVYTVHGILGGTALIIILFHPIFLVLKFIPSNARTALKYLLPSSFWSVNFGIIALLSLIFLIGLTLFTKIKYNKWKFSHEFLGLVFILAVLHIFLVRGVASRDNIFNGYYVYAIAVSFIGIAAFSYSLFIKDRIMKNAVYIISNIEKNKNRFVIEMTPDHKPISYKSGQFIFVRFYNKNLSREEHPFSITSKSNSNNIQIIVKKLGDFTNKLENVKVGDKVSVEGPYGRFNADCKSTNQIWIAAGIGITPFLGMLEDLLGCAKTPEVDLYYSVNDDSDFIGYNSILEIQSQIKTLNFIPWNSTKRGRLTLEDIDKISGKLKDKEFFLCGPEGFKEGIIHNLIKLGISKDRIHEEAFDLR